MVTWNDSGPLVFEPKPGRPERLPARLEKLLGDVGAEGVKLRARKEEELGVGALFLGHLEGGEAEQGAEGGAGAVGVGGKGGEG